MALDLVNYREQARDAIKAFWGNREAAAKKQAETGNIDMGTRGDRLIAALEFRSI